VNADRDLAKWFVNRYPNLRPQLNSDQSLTFRLKRYLYGLQESPLAWNKTLHDKLYMLGFDRSNADLCLYTRKATHGKTYLTVHVDDMMLAFPSSENKKWFETAMKGWYEIVTQDTNITYLGMSVTKNIDGIKVHQSGYIDTLCDKFLGDSTSISSSPTSTDFLQTNIKDVEVNITKYLGIVMSLMY